MHGPDDQFLGASGRFTPRTNRLIDRDHELELIQSMLRDEVRLLTLTGPAGVGKTRLALEAGSRLTGSFPHGVTFVDLAPVRDPDLVLPTLAQQIGVHDQGLDALLDRLAAYLKDRTTLLILDNFEQVVPAAGELGELLGSCPGVRMLVTSRIPLHLQWEHTVLVSPLHLPDLDQLVTLDELSNIPSVALFVQRARARLPDFGLTPENARMVAELCIRLDGLPLAIELAAARMNALSLSVIVHRLGNYWHVLKSEAVDLPDRHRSLHAAIDWSYQLLTDAEQHLFRHLGVFVGHISLGAVDAVAGTNDGRLTLDALASLAEKSLVLPARQEDDDEASFGILETMREYALEQLDRLGELHVARDRHAHYFLELAERADPHLRGHDQRIWFLRLEQEHDNLRTALRWLLDQGDGERALRLAGALGHFWWIRGYHAEGWRWLEETLRSAPDADPANRIAALLRAGTILAYKGEHERARPVLEEAYARAWQRDDRAASAQALTYLGECATFAGDFTESHRLLQEAQARWEELGDEADHFQLGILRSFLGVMSFMQGEYEQAASILSESVAHFHAGGDAHTAGHVLFYLAVTSRKLGDLTRSVQHLQDGLEVGIRFQDRWQLSLGVEAALLVIGDRAGPEEQARLEGAADALSEVTGYAANYWERVTGQRVAPFSDALQKDGLDWAYQEGRSLSFKQMGDLALQVLKHANDDAGSADLLPIVESSQRVLSEREQEVIKLVAEGLANKAIAEQLNISPSTVSYHLTSIFNKLGVNTRAQAVSVATHRNIL